MASKFSVVLKKDRLDGGYVALVPELPGCISDGDTRADALSNIKDAIRLYLQSIEAEKARARAQSRKSASIDLTWVTVGA